MSAPPVRDFRDLIVWQRAMALARVAYALSHRLPVTERQRLGDQIRRAAASIGANIAEGHAKPYRREFLRYLRIEYGSSKELQHHVIMAETVGLLRREQVADALALATELARMLSAMLRRLSDPP